MDGELISNQQKPDWNSRYGKKHQWRRVSTWPPGMAAPAKVRLYQRAEHFLLNWWDPAAKKSRTERITCDWLTAVTRAREIEGRVLAAKSIRSIPASRVSHEELVDRFLEDLSLRADAREIASHTVDRYRSALEHYLAYCRLPAVRQQYPRADSVDREFQLGFRTYLLDRVRMGTRSHSAGRPLKGTGFILDTVRAAYAWATDPTRGNVLPDDFRHPFLRGGSKDSAFVGDPLSEPAITMTMAADFIRAAGDDEKCLFLPIILFGLRAAEPCHLFGEHVKDDWLLVPNMPGLDYFTKGRRDKRFPWISELLGYRDSLRQRSPTGLLFRRPAQATRPDAKDFDLTAYEKEYATRLRLVDGGDHRARRRIRLDVHRDAGGMTYDDIDARFRRIAAHLGWARSATLKDFRHLFATTLANANLAEGYRKYLLGHAPGREAAVAYTHLNQLRQSFAAVLRSELACPFGETSTVRRYRTNSSACVV